MDITIKSLQLQMQCQSQDLIDAQKRIAKQSAELHRVHDQMAKNKNADV